MVSGVAGKEITVIDGHSFKIFGISQLKPFRCDDIDIILNIYFQVWKNMREEKYQASF